jgi:hypothetical protein
VIAKSTLAFGPALLLAACAAISPPPPATPVERPGLLSRDLSASEKTALSHALSRTLKDPDSAKFQWGPVKYTAGSTYTDYCGIINAKNSYGGYTGFKMFHATLNANSKGQYDNGTIDRIMVDSATADVDDLKDNVHYEELCIQGGYGSISLVPQ